MKPCLIKQPAGIGDIFFCQKIARYMMYHGYDVIWPVLPSISWIKDYIKDIDFPTVEDGVRGMAFIEACVKSSISESKWYQLEEKIG